ncbi:MAG: GNAT family N-acetyltransferase [Bacteroidales bacterium]|nr:GNAT family N-acetyltransferase [Bacteroidales bacterium]
MDIEFGKLKREEMKAAVEIASRAYQDYAYVALYFPDDEERRRGLHAFMNCVMKSNFGRADLLAARQAGRLVGRATLEGPDYRPPTFWQSLVNDGWKVYFAANWKNVNGYLAMDEEACKPCLDYQKTNPGVWYLSMFEVDPLFQGQGIGTQFLTYQEDYVRQRGGSEMVLFTNSEENLRFYTRRGYEVFYACEIEHDGRKVGSWSLKKTL